LAESFAAARDLLTLLSQAWRRSLPLADICFWSPATGSPAIAFQLGDKRHHHVIFGRRRQPTKLTDV
jgi:hypothetical protein